MSDASKIDPDAYDRWLTDQDRWYGDDLVTDDMLTNWNEANSYNEDRPVEYDEPEEQQAN